MEVDPQQLPLPSRNRTLSALRNGKESTESSRLSSSSDNCGLVPNIYKQHQNKTQEQCARSIEKDQQAVQQQGIWGGIGIPTDEALAEIPATEGAAPACCVAEPNSVKSIFETSAEQCARAWPPRRSWVAWDSELRHSCRLKRCLPRCQST